MREAIHTICKVAEQDILKRPSLTYTLKTLTYRSLQLHITYLIKSWVILTYLKGLDGNKYTYTKEESYLEERKHLHTSSYTHTYTQKKATQTHQQKRHTYVLRNIFTTKAP